MAHFPRAWKTGQLPPGVFPKKGLEPLFEALTVSAHELQEMLIAGTVSSADLVEEYVSRIEKYNPYLNAISEYAPSAMKNALEMDAARKSGRFLGPLHGIPIVLKDSVATGWVLGMATTGGAAALWGSVPSKNAAIVDKLQEAGAIILGKATMSELGWHKGDNIPCGWSSYAGQSNSAYVRGGISATDAILGHSSPSGSSSGPCVALSAGLSPLAIGTDTEGSLKSPAARAALYSMRSTTGIIPTNGIVPLAHSFDIAGPLAKSVLDLANLLTVLVDSDKTDVPEGGYKSVIGKGWGHLKVGTLDVEPWLYPDIIIKSTPETQEQIVRDTKAAYSQISKLVGSYHENVSLRSWQDFAFNGVHSIVATFNAELKDDLGRYLAGVEETNIRSLQDMVDWNVAHPEDGIPEVHPSQSALIAALTSNFTKEEAAVFRQQYLNVGISFEETLNKYDIDIIIGPGDSFFTAFAAANGCPVAAMPLSTLNFNGRPFGLMAMARPHKESLLIEVLSAFESTFPPRQTPTAFLSGNLTRTPVASKV